MKNQLRKYVCVLMLGLSWVALGEDEVPMLINCQGRLFDGEKLLNGKISMVLRIYTNATKGEALFEDASMVEVVDGVYSTYIGDNPTRGNLAQALSHGDAYLEVEADGVVFPPRERLVAVPYALVADGVSRAGVTADMLGADVVMSEHIADGAITADQLAPDAVSSENIRDYSIDSEDLAPGSVTPDKLKLNYWSTSGNIGDRGKENYLGTIDDRPLEMRVNNKTAFRLSPNPTSPNVIGGSEANTVSDQVEGATVSGGGRTDRPNAISKSYGYVGGGTGNHVNGEHGSIAGGLDNRVEAHRASILGGRDNKINGHSGVIGGGYSNKVMESFATIGGGAHNRAGGYVSTVGGGWRNNATGVVSAVGGGQENITAGAASVVSGGWKNKSMEYASSVLGGRDNEAQGAYSTVGGGASNIASEAYATIPGGQNNKAIGRNSLAAGKGATAGHEGSFVWSDGTGEIGSSREHQFIIQARGNVGINTDRPDETLTVSGNVKAMRFIGDGSGLTGINIDNIVEDGALPPNKIQGEALTRTTEFQGMVQGNAEDLRIPSGAIGTEQLAQGAVTPEKLSDQYWSTSGNTISSDQRGFLGLKNEGPFILGVNGQPVLLLSDEGGEKRALISGTLFADQIEGNGRNLTGVVAEGLVDQTIRNQHISPDAQIDPTKIAGGVVTLDQNYSGDVQGTYSNLQLVAGTIQLDHLSENFTLPVRMIDGGILTLQTLFQGDVTGSPDQLTIADKAIGAEHLKDNSIQVFHLSDEIKLLLTREISGLEDDAVLTRHLSDEVLTLIKSTIENAGLKEQGIALVHLSDEVKQYIETPPIISNEYLDNGAVTTEKLSPDLKIPVRMIDGGILTLQTLFQGDVSGAADQLVLGENVVSAENLQNNSVQTQHLSNEIKALLTRDIIVDENGVENKAIQPRHLSDEINTMLNREIVVNENGIEDKTIALRHLSDELSNLVLRPEQITKESLADGSVSLDKLTPALKKALQEPKSLDPETIPNKSISPEKLTVPIMVLEPDPQGSIRLGTESAAIRLVEDADAPSIVAGSEKNQRSPQAKGVVIAGGGNSQYPQQTTASFTTIGGGLGNQTGDAFSTVSGGMQNEASGTAAAIGGGWKNRATAQSATVSGGQENQATAIGASVGGGYQNKATGEYSTVPGGKGSEANADQSFAAGTRAKANHNGSFVWADQQEQDFASTAPNQFLVRATGNMGIDTDSPTEKLTIGGNVAPASSDQHSLGTDPLRWQKVFVSQAIDFDQQISLTANGQQVLRVSVDEGVFTPGVQAYKGKGGTMNVRLGDGANVLSSGVAGGVIAGGGDARSPQQLSGDYGTIGGGLGNTVTSMSGTLSGGQENSVQGAAGTISGGFDNDVSGEFGTVAGGAQNKVEGRLASIGGGYGNEANGQYAFVAGGAKNKASGNYSFAAGRFADAQHDGTYVWADSGEYLFPSTGQDQYRVRAGGGVWFFSDTRLQSGVKLNPGSGSWAMLSDRNAKADIAEIDPVKVLEQLKNVPVYAWRYAGEPENVRHIGPVSQEFYDAFGVGDDDRYITSIDADGVALSAIRGLQQLFEEQEETVDLLKQENRALRERLEKIEALLQQAQ